MISPNQTNLIFGILIISILMSIIIMIILVVRGYTNTIKNQHEEKLAMAEAQSKATAVKPFDDLRSVVEYIASFYVAHEVSLINKNNLTEDEMTEMLEQYTAQISAQISASLSQELKRQMLCYTTTEFLDYFIRKTTLTMLMQVLKPNNTK